MQGQLEVESAAEDVVAEVAGVVGLVDRGLQPATGVDQLAAQVDEGVVAAHRERRDDDAFDQRVRIGHHQRGVFAGAGLALVGVDHEVVRLAVALRE